jgi:hypothetical protein
MTKHEWSTTKRLLGSVEPVALAHLEAMCGLPTAAALHALAGDVISLSESAMEEDVAPQTQELRVPHPLPELAHKVELTCVGTTLSQTSATTELTCVRGTVIDPTAAEFALSVSAYAQAKENMSKKL